MKVIFDKEKQKIPVKMWLDKVEDGAMLQIMNLTNLPFAFHHLAIMPDCHQGYGMPIGGVLATDKVIIPNAVGVDIGCGMCAVKTSLKVEQLNKEMLKLIMGKIREVIPVGFEHQKERQDYMLMPGSLPALGLKDEYNIIFKEYGSALTQLGTLGGGNHFIEIQKELIECPSCKGELESWMPCQNCRGTKKIDGNVWIMIHSGSRNLGKKVADYYNGIAVSLNEKWFSQVPKEWQLAFLPIESEEAKDYFNEMQYCVDFALANRKLMMERILQIFADTLTESKIYGLLPLEPMINIAHNYAKWENHFGQNVIVHRKGATLAREGTIGIIPGSQGTKSYIVRGLGNKESFESCSHGAGRLMGRKDAERRLNLEEQIKIMEDKGIVHGIRGKGNLDEAPGAYKPIEEVMANQVDLVEILVELIPLAVIKGD